MKVYNIIGQEVATLVNGVKGPGRYSVEFDGTRLANGVYYYRLESGRNSITKKLMPVK